jgi:sulfur-oxidizing protein SoxA
MECDGKTYDFWRPGIWLLAALAVGLACAAMELSLAEEPSRYIVDGRRSGYTYLSEENQRLQDDDFANPGLLWVERGRELWRHGNWHKT